MSTKSKLEAARGEPYGGRVTTETKVSQIRKRLETAILDGTLRPGDRIVLDEVARELGVSLIPVREALSGLQAEGLVVSSPYVGPSVAPLPLHEWRAVYLLREETEALTTRLAASQASEALVTELEGINQEMRTNSTGSNYHLLAELNADFHLAIARATTYDTLVEAVAMSLRKVRRYRNVTFRLSTNWSAAVVEHDLLIEALRDGSAEAAATSMREHLRNQRAIEFGEDETNGREPITPSAPRPHFPGGRDPR